MRAIALGFNTLNRPEIIKLSLLGAGGVGKSTLVARLVSGKFMEKHMTVGIDIDTWMLVLDGLPPSKVSFFDFGGQEQFRFFQAPLMVGSKIALIVFDCCSYRTLLAVEEWMPITSNIPNEYKLLIGNKLDNPNKIDEEEIRRFSEKFDLDYIMVSAKEGTNFEDLENRIKEMIRSLISQ